MQIPSVAELEEAAKKLVWAAKKEGTLKKLTPRLIRQTIEQQLSLEEASLDASEYKSAIKSATMSALDEDPPSEKEETLKPSAKKVNKKRKSGTQHEEDDQPTPKSKGKSSATASKDTEDDGSAKKKRKTVKTKKVESEDEKKNSENEDSEEVTTKTKKSKRKDTKQFKSLEHVPTSDMEQDEPDITGPPVTKTDSPKKKKATPLQTKTVPSKSSKEAKNPESKPTDSQQSEVPDVVMKDVVGDISSELSELDEPKPKPKQKAKALDEEPKKTKTKKKEKEKKNAKASTTLTNAEETIKRLKSLVLACGVRKVWSKVFQGLDSPNQQIKKLKEILAELGMTGRMGMDKAKTIKQKRELARELEDVREFEKTVLGRSSRGQSKTTAKVAADEEDDTEKDKGTGDEEEDETPKRRPNNARKSIASFLASQSDEE